MTSFIKTTMILASLSVALLSACKGKTENEAKTGDAQEVASADSAKSITLTIQKENSEFKWFGHKPTGDHFGHISVKEGTLSLENGTLKSGKFVLDMKSITVEDMKDPADNKDLQEHLQSGDFFEVDKNPETVFEITQVKSLNADSSIIAGNLTIKGKTNNIEFPAKLSLNGESLEATAKFSIDRLKWDLNYHSEKSLGNKFIYPNIDFEIKLKAAK